VSLPLAVGATFSSGLWHFRVTSVYGDRITSKSTGVDGAVRHTPVRWVNSEAWIRSNCEVDSVHEVESAERGSLCQT